MPSNAWHDVALGDLIDIKHGYAFKGEYFRDEPTEKVLLTPGNFAIGGGYKADKLKYYDGPVPEEFVLAGGDLLITMTDLSKATDTLGYPALVPLDEHRRYLHNQRLGKVIARGDAPIDRQFLYYLLCTKTYRNEIVAGATGTTVKHTSPDRIRSYRTRIPIQLDEQRAIAHILSTLDDKIELNRRMNETLEEIARAIFKSWFVDFDPVCAKASGEHNDFICRRLSLTSDLLALFPDSFQDSDLGKIPAGWAAVLLGSLCSRMSMGPFGSDIKTDNFVEVGVPVVRGGNLTDGFVDEGFVFVSEEKADQLRNANARSGDIVITHRGTLGQVGLIPKESRYPRYVVSQSQMVLSINPNLSSPQYVFEFLRSPIGQHRLLANASQVGVPAIARPTTSAKAILIVSPCMELLRAFERLVEPMSECVVANTSESRTLATLRDTLLPKLISGEIRASELQW